MDRETLDKIKEWVDNAEEYAVTWIDDITGYMVSSGKLLDYLETLVKQ